MKSLNENWFPITLIAVVFGLIGYLIGTNSSKHHCPMMGDMDNHKIFMKKMHGMDSFSWSSDDKVFFSEDGDIEIDIDSIVEYKIIRFYLCIFHCRCMTLILFQC